MQVEVERFLCKRCFQPGRYRRRLFACKPTTHTEPHTHTHSLTWQVMARVARGKMISFWRKTKKNRRKKLFNMDWPFGKDSNGLKWKLKLNLATRPTNGEQIKWVTRVGQDIPNLHSFFYFFILFDFYFTILESFNRVEEKIGIFAQFSRQSQKLLKLFY